MRVILPSLAGAVALAAASVAAQTAPPQPAPGATGATRPAATTVGVYGSNTIGAELMPRLIEEYAFSRGESATRESGEVAEETLWTVRGADGRVAFRVDLRSHGSGTSARGLASGEAEIGMSSRPIKDSEVAALAEAGITGMRSPDQQHVVALDGLIVIVSPENPVGALSLETVARIFAGEITDWSEVGRAPGAIVVHARDDKSGTYDTFESLVLDAAGLALRADANRYESNAELSDAVANDPDAIGFTGFAYLRNARALDIGSSCGIVTAPSVFGVKTEEYPLARRLYLYTTGQAMTPEAGGLLAFALSDEAQDAVVEVGFIDQAIDALPFDAQGRRIATAQLQPSVDFDGRTMREALRDLMFATRLSTTFRFETGSSELDGKARTDIRRLARRLAQPDMAGREVMLIGFADSVGSFATNLRLAEGRARQVLDELRSADPALEAMAMEAKGYGELMPIACNDTETGRAKNRRVEIWVR